MQVIFRHLEAKCLDLKTLRNDKNVRVYSYEDKHMKIRTI